MWGTWGHWVLRWGPVKFIHVKLGTLSRWNRKGTNTNKKLLQTDIWPSRALTQQKTSEAESSSNCPMMIRTSLSCQTKKQQVLFLWEVLECKQISILLSIICSICTRYLQLPQAAAGVFRETLCGNNLNIGLQQLSDQILLHLHKESTSNVMPHKDNRNLFLRTLQS